MQIVEGRNEGWGLRKGKQVAKLLGGPQGAVDVHYATLGGDTSEWIFSGFRRVLIN